MTIKILFSPEDCYMYFVLIPIVPLTIITHLKLLEQIQLLQ